MPKTLIEIIDKTIKRFPDMKWIKSELRSNFYVRFKKPILAAYIVGSTAKGTNKENSDLDIAIVIDPIRGKTSLEYTEWYHQHFTDNNQKPHWNGSVVDFQFFYPNDPEIKRYNKIKLQEKISIHKSFDEYIKLVANAYENAPEYDISVVHHWDALNKADHNLFKQIQSKVKIIFVDGQPYNSMYQMKSDVKENKQLLISKDYNEHPIFSKEDNLIFRTVHDWFEHIIIGAPFGAHGEIRAYNAACKLFPKEAVPALFTEIIGQGSVAITTGKFPIQKIALLNGFDYWNIGVLNSEYHEHDKRMKQLSKVLF